MEEEGRAIAWLRAGGGDRRGDPSPGAARRAAAAAGRHVVAASRRAARGRLLLFPVAYIVSAAFNADQSLSGSSLIPRRVTLDNFRALLSSRRRRKGTYSAANYARWFVNTHRLLHRGRPDGAPERARRVRLQPLPLPGRRLGMLALLPIQMFPSLLLVVAIYLILLHTGEGLPRDRPEHADRADRRLPRRRDGRQHLADEGLLRHDPGRARRVGARRRRDTRADLLGVVLPLALPVLAVIGADLLHLDAERVRLRERAAPVERKVHARGRAARLTSTSSTGALGAVRRRRAARRDPRRRPVPGVPALARRRPDGRSRQGMTSGARSTSRTTTSSASTCSSAPDDPGGEATVRLRVPRERLGRGGGPALRRRRAARRAGRGRRGDRDGDVVARDVVPVPRRTRATAGS